MSPFFTSSESAERGLYISLAVVLGLMTFQSDIDLVVDRTVRAEVVTADQCFIKSSRGDLVGHGAGGGIMAGQASVKALLVRTVIGHTIKDRTGDLHTITAVAGVGRILRNGADGCTAIVAERVNIHAAIYAVFGTGIHIGDIVAVEVDDGFYLVLEDHAVVRIAVGNAAQVFKAVHGNQQVFGLAACGHITADCGIPNGLVLAMQASAAGHVAQGVTVTVLGAPYRPPRRSCRAAQKRGCRFCGSPSAGFVFNRLRSCSR